MITTETTQLNGNPIVKATGFLTDGSTVVGHTVINPLMTDEQIIASVYQLHISAAVELRDQYRFAGLEFSAGTQFSECGYNWY